MTIFETVKAAVSLRDAAKRYGLKVAGNNMTCCPFHNDRNPSMKLNRDYFYCFGCGETGDVIDFVGKLFGISPIEAAQSLYDRSIGFFRRQIILTAKEKAPGRRDDPFIADKMCHEVEGIFLWALEGLQRLIQNDYKFTVSEAAKENMESAVTDGNNVIEFLASEGYIQFNPDSTVRFIFRKARKNGMRKPIFSPILKK